MGIRIRERWEAGRMQTHSKGWADWERMGMLRHILDSRLDSWPHSKPCSWEDWLPLVNINRDPIIRKVPPTAK